MCEGPDAANASLPCTVQCPTAVSTSFTCRACTDEDTSCTCDFNQIWRNDLQPKQCGGRREAPGTSLETRLSVTELRRAGNCSTPARERRRSAGLCICHSPPPAPAAALAAGCAPGFADDSCQKCAEGYAPAPGSVGPEADGLPNCDACAAGYVGDDCSKCSPDAAEGYCTKACPGAGYTGFVGCRKA